VKKDFMGGVRSGVSGTPGIFINGNFYKGDSEFVNSITNNLYIGLSVYVLATMVAFLLPALSILACSALWILWGRMAFMHFVPRNPKDATKGSEIGPHEG